MQATAIVSAKPRGGFPRFLSVLAASLVCVAALSPVNKGVAANSGQEASCGAPLTRNAKPAASDCLHILKVAVGSAVCAPSCICRPSGGSFTRASDALVCLAAAVGLRQELNCPCAPPTTLLLGSTTTLPPVSTSSTTTTTVDPFCGLPVEECAEDRGPNGISYLDSDGCSAQAVIDALAKLGRVPEDPESVKDDPVKYFTDGRCSAPFGNDGSFTEPRACELHDSCTSTCGQPNRKCSDEFLTRLQDICLNTFAPGPCLVACTTVAAAYGINQSAPSVGEGYWSNQNLYCECCPDRSACGDGVCERSIGEGAANCPEDCKGQFADNAFCVTHDDCASGFCSGQARCGKSVCGDGFCGSGERCEEPDFCAQDCGGCPNGRPCLLNRECASDVCEVVCVEAGSLDAGAACVNDEACGSGDCFPGPGFCTGSCGDGKCSLLPDGETCRSSGCQLDCGACSLGEGCLIDEDCASDNCLAGICAPQKTCGDGSCNGAERCGNANSGAECNQDCGKCGNGKVCPSNSDCSSGICNFGVCIGSPRDDGKACSTSAACDSGKCTLGICACTRDGLGSRCSRDSDCCSDDCGSVFGVKRCK